MRIGPGLCATIVCAALAGQAQAASVHTDRCNGKQRRTVALTPQVRTYADTSDVYHACVRRTGRTIELFESDGIYTSGVIRAAAGFFVAYEFSHTPECKADCPPGVVGSDTTRVADVRTGDERLLHDGYVGTLILRRSGNVAWVSGTPPSASLRMWPFGGSSTLVDRGGVSAVRASRGRLEWDNAGQHHSVPFA